MQIESVVSVGLYKAAMDSAKEKVSEIETKNVELKAYKTKLSDLEKRLLENEKKHSNTLATSLKHQSEKKESEKKIAELQSALQEERQSSKVAVETAKQESKNLRNQMEDLKFELQENGGDFGGKIMKTPLYNGPQTSRALEQPRNISPSPRNRLLESPAPKKSLAPRVAPVTAPTNKENAVPAPNVGGKQFQRFNFVQRAGGRKGLREKVQKMRSPKARQILKTM